MNFLQCVNNTRGASGSAGIQNFFKMWGLLFRVHGNIISDISIISGIKRKPWKQSKKSLISGLGLLACIKASLLAIPCLPKPCRSAAMLFWGSCALSVSPNPCQLWQAVPTTVPILFTYCCTPSFCNWKNKMFGFTQTHYRILISLFSLIRLKFGVVFQQGD